MPQAERGSIATAVAEPIPELGTLPAAWGWLFRPWLAVLVGCACHINGLPDGFVYDDVSQVAENAAIRSAANVREIWFGGWSNAYSGEEARMHPNPDRLYRPLTAFTLALNSSVHGVWAPGFRAVNIALHGLACFLVWKILRRLFEDDALATWGAVLFAVHPVHVEAVTYIVGRAEVLATVFTLWGLLVLVPKNRPSDAGRALRALPLFFLALLSKETAVSYIPVALIVLYALRRCTPQRGTGWWGMHTACLLLPLLVYVSLRLLVLGGQLKRDPAELLNPLVNADMPARLLMPFEVLGHYTRLLLFPLHLSADYGYQVLDPGTGANLMTVLGLATAAGLVAALVGFVRSGPQWRRFALCAALFIASYALFSNTLLLIGVSVAERLMYWPSVWACGLLVGLALALGRGLPASERAWRRLAPGLGRVAGVLLLLACAGRTVARNQDWRDGMRLFTHDAQAWPASAALNASAGSEYIDVALHAGDQAARRQALERADQYYERALQHYPRHWGYQFQLSDILSSLGQADGALRHVQQAVQLNPRDTMLRAKLGRRLFEAGQVAEALPYLEEEVQSAPGGCAALILLGQAQLKLGRADEARRQLEKAISLAPQDAAELRELADALLKLKEPDRAIPVLEKLAELAPSELRTCAVLAKLLLARDPAAALRYAQHGCELAPRDPGTRLLLADALIANGRSAEGIAIYSETLDHMPADAPMRPQVQARLEQLQAAMPPAPPDRP